MYQTRGTQPDYDPGILKLSHISLPAREIYREPESPESV